VLPLCFHVKLSDTSTDSERAIPAGLGFDDVIKNKALPVCDSHAWGVHTSAKYCISHVHWTISWITWCISSTTPKIFNSTCGIRIMSVDSMLWTKRRGPFLPNGARKPQMSRIWQKIQRRSQRRRQRGKLSQAWWKQDMMPRWQPCSVKRRTLQVLLDHHSWRITGVSWQHPFQMRQLLHQARPRWLLKQVWNGNHVRWHFRGLGRFTNCLQSQFNRWERK